MAVYTAKQIYGFAREAGFSPDQSATMTAIALAESGGNSQAHNPSGEDSRGLWQINLDAHRSWAGGIDLYDPVENAKAAFRVSREGQDISPWTVTHGGGSARYLQHRAEAQTAAVLNGDEPGLGVWTGTSGYGSSLAAGDSDGGGGAVPFAAFNSAGQDGAVGQDDGNAQAFLDAALKQAGDRYIFGAEASSSDPDPDAFDCSEIVEWAAAQVGVTVPDGTWLQYLHLKEQGAIVPVEQAINTPGALLFSFSQEPTPGGARPSQAHVAISLGDGKTIEARGTQYGVGSFEASPQRFEYAAVIPGITGSFTPGAQMQAAPTFADADMVDTDADGLIDALELQMGTDPTVADTDQDGLSDSYELLKVGTDPTLADSDEDQIGDATELAMGTDPLDADTHRVGRLDSAEGRPEAFVDTDSDQLSDELEAVLGTDANSIDSDRDGIVDGMEYLAGFDPADAMSSPAMAGAEEETDGLVPGAAPANAALMPASYDEDDDG